MHHSSQFAKNSTNAVASFALCSALAFTPIHAVAQMSMPPAQPSQSQPQPDAAMQTQDTQAQITQLRQQVVQLQAALQQSKTKGNTGSKGSMKTAKPAMGMEDDSGEMGGMSSGDAKPPMGQMKDDSGEMGGMAASGGAMKGGDEEPMGGPGCCGMSMGKPMAKPAGMAGDKMSGMAGGSMPAKGSTSMSASTMAQTPHVLHVGAKDFFLDHAQHISLTPEQTASLEKVKSNSAQQKANSQRQIDSAQQELWQLTSAEQPNAAEIDKKVREIADLRADEQVTFIQAVSTASDVLTREQRAEVVEAMPAAHHTGSKMSKQPTDPAMKMQ